MRENAMPGERQYRDSGYEAVLQPRGEDRDQ